MSYFEKPGEDSLIIDDDEDGIEIAETQETVFAN